VNIESLGRGLGFPPKIFGFGLGFGLVVNMLGPVKILGIPIGLSTGPRKLKIGLSGVGFGLGFMISPLKTDSPSIEVSGFGINEIGPSSLGVCCSVFSVTKVGSFGGIRSSRLCLISSPQFISCRNSHALCCSSTLRFFS